MTGRGLDCLPKNIGDLTNLCWLFLAGNSLTFLPESIGNATDLETLDLSMNQLTTLPESFKNLSNLTELIIFYNGITKMPDSLSYLISLTTLDLYGNQISKLPNSIGNLKNLIKLNLNDNQITEIPNSIRNLKNLNEIELDNNSLTNLSIFQSLPVLETVRLFNVDLPRRYWMKFSDWNPEWLLDEENSEIRKTLIEQVGYEKICDKLGAIEIDTWREYHLLKINADVDLEPIFLLKMTCPSTQHIHVLRVPPTMTSAEESIVWINHGIHPDNFAVQT